jgi:hypothetical protein
MTTMMMMMMIMMQWRRRWKGVAKLTALATPWLSVEQHQQQQQQQQQSWGMRRGSRPVSQIL